MDRFFSGGPPSVLSYFLLDPDIQTSLPLRAPATGVAPRAEARVTPLPAEMEPVRQAVLIFCDGACANNGRRGARAGFGVVVLRDGVELTAVSEPLRPEEPQTNQRAELRGLALALSQAGILAASGTTTVRIYTDSEYAINCLTKWMPGWKRAGWKRATGEPVLHRDILEPLHDAWVALRGVAFLEHVAAHTGRGDLLSRGNERADALARASLASSPASF